MVRFSAIQTMTITVWMARKRPVPRKRATFSENRANQSGSSSNRARPSRGWSRRRLVVFSGIGHLVRLHARLAAPGGLRRGDLALDDDPLRLLGGVLGVGEPVAPVDREQVVEHVVDGDRTEEVVLAVHDRPGHQV